MENRKKEVLILVVLLIIQVAIHIAAGINKSYLHMDEAYSFGLASYDKIDIEDNEDFANVWHSGEYYEDYLSVQDDEIGKYSRSL